MKTVSDSSTNPDLPPLREVIRSYDLRAEKSLGQNFLLDGNVTDKIVSLVQPYLSEKTTAFEIGPGPGGLTRSLLKSDVQKVIAIEFDERAIRALGSLQECYQERLELVQSDALDIQICSLSDAPRAIIANLPYNIATPLLINWLRDIANSSGSFDVMALMFQKEVGDRIVASVGSKAYGRLSIIAQWLCGVQKIYDLPPSAFTPPPKVYSSVIRFVPKRNNKDGHLFEKLERITALAFQQRRKMIRSSLKVYLKEIEQAEIDPTLRAENLSVDDFIKIASLI